MKNLFDIFKPIIYVQISPERLILRNVKSGEVISEIPEVAIDYDNKERIVGIGSEASFHRSNPSVKIINPFAHPRTLLSDFTVAEQMLKIFIRRMQGSSFFSVSPKIVIHPLGEPAGGFTQIERRAFHELALGAGASQVVFREGRVLTDQEILSG